jgi:predicted DCC family thiol-disulfide oxidoreductase YuxK
MTTAIYDGYCILCIQSKRLIERLDWRKRIEFLDLHDGDTVKSRYPHLAYEQLMGEIHVVTADRKLLQGFEGMRFLLRALPLGFPLWLILHLPGMTWLGQKGYRFIARNRYRINRFFGMPVCENGVCKIHKP